MFENFIRKVKDYIKSELNKLSYVNSANYNQIKIGMHSQMELQGKIASLLIKQNLGILSNIQNAEFKVYSQWGDDGIIQYLINNVDITNKVFIEFGVENYEEANTRFLLFNNNWSGLVLDGSKENIDYIKKSDFFWKFDLKAKATFITKENINELIYQEGLEGNIGILSIDIDGNDYWIWEEIKVVEPDIVIVEYNSVFGNERSITIPYDPAFIRSKAHHSNLYAGCSLPALYSLGLQKGYVFVGSNSAGNNAYFVKKEKAGNLKVLTLVEGYVNSQFRESRNINGELNFTRADNRKNILKGMPVYNIITNEIEAI